MENLLPIVEAEPTMKAYVTWVIIGNTSWPTGTIMARNEEEAYDKARNRAQQEYSCIPDSVHAVPSVYSKE